MKKTKKKISSSNQRPVGVTILGVLGYIGAVMTLLLALIMLFASNMIVSLIAQAVPGAAIYVAAGTIVLIVIGILLIGCAVLDYYIARGLLAGKNWARIVMLVLCALSVFGSLWPFSIVGLALNGLIIWYLGFYEPAVSYFK